MTAKHIMALAQAHRKEGGVESYRAFADAVKALVAERDAAVAACIELRGMLAVGADECVKLLEQAASGMNELSEVPHVRG